jgi:hypothetical protein
MVLHINRERDTATVTERNTRIMGHDSSITQSKETGAASITNEADAYQEAAASLRLAADWLDKLSQYVRKSSRNIKPMRRPS